MYVVNKLVKKTNAHMELKTNWNEFKKNLN